MQKLGSIHASLTFFVLFNNNNIQGEDLVHVPVKKASKPLPPASDLGRCPFYGGGSVVVDSWCLYLPLFVGVLFLVFASVCITLCPF